MSRPNDQPTHPTRPAVRPALRVILALPAARSDAAARRLQLFGCAVERAADAAEAGRLAHRTRPDAVVLPADGGFESGALTCAKLKLVQPHLRVVLVGGCRRAAGHVGARWLPESAGPAEVARAALDGLIDPHRN
jgi:hypothetical protein